MVERRWGWVPDFPHTAGRSQNFLEVMDRALVVPPVKYLNTVPVEDQGQEGSCVFHGTTTAMECVQVKQFLYSPPFHPFRDLSRQFAYYNYRAAYADINKDEGASIGLAITQISKIGVCREDLWPYKGMSNFAVKPSAAAYANAPSNLIKKFLNIAADTADKSTLITQITNCIASGYGIVFGISVFASFESEQVAVTGIVPVPKASEKFLGGHCVYMHGYDMNKKVVYVQNSWGTDWGMQAPCCSTRGHFTLPFDYFGAGLADSFWTIRVVT